MQKKEYTIMTRFRLSEELEVYLNEFVTEYNKIYRVMWHKMTAPDYKKNYPKESYFVTEICQKYGLLKRTVNSIRYDIKGRMKSLQELKKTELQQLDIKINVQAVRVKSISETIHKMKPLAATNQLDDKQLERYRRLKQSLYYKKNRLNQMRQKAEKLQYEIQHGILKLGFGGKNMFRKQYHLSENGYKTHEKWYHDYRKARDKNIFYLGSSDESAGNQLLQMTYNQNTDDFSFLLRKEYAWCQSDSPMEKYIYVEHIHFQHLQKELVDVVTSHQNGRGVASLTYRFHRKGTKWYLQVIFPILFQEYKTFSKYGVMGLDYNDGFIELSETDEKGNLIYQHHYELNYHGCGTKAENEIRNVIHAICSYAERKGKDIVIENLSFQKTKSKTQKAKSKQGKQYNRMIHLFDYRRYRNTMENTCHRRHILLHKVKAFQTSKIGKQKYCDKKKLNVHQAASYVIARRGQGFMDKLEA